MYSHLLIPPLGIPYTLGDTMAAIQASLRLDAASPDGLHTLWAFEGRITYKKSSKKIDWSRDWWHYALQAPLMLGGNFDEVTGDVEVIDLADPQFTCSVKLLRVY